MCGNGKSCSTVCSQFVSEDANMSCLTVMFDETDEQSQAENLCKNVISKSSNYCQQLPKGILINQLQI